MTIKLQKTHKRVKDTLEFERIRAIPKPERTPEEEKTYHRLYGRMQRYGDDALTNFSSATEFWQANKLNLGGVAHSKLLQQQEAVLDQTEYLNNGWTCSPDDDLFISVDDLLAELDEAKLSFISDDPMDYRHPDLKEFQPLYAVWMPAPTYDPIHGRIEAFYTDSERFRALCSENEATKVYAQTGIRIAQSAFHARRFVGRVTAHRAGAHKSEPEPKCYVCKNGGKS